MARPNFHQVWDAAGESSPVRCDCCLEGRPDCRLGIKTAVERGHYPGIPPYGRRCDRELKQMVIEETEARWYREMFAWSIAGDGDAKIASRLNGLGVPTRRQGRVTRTGRSIGKGWTAGY